MSESYATLNEVRKSLGLRPVIRRMVCSCANCGFAERLPVPLGDWDHQCGRLARLRYRIALRWFPELWYPRYCGTCGRLIMVHEQWATSCVHCDPRARKGRGA